MSTNFIWLVPQTPLNQLLCFMKKSKEENLKLVSAFFLKPLIKMSLFSILASVLNLLSRKLKDSLKWVMSHQNLTITQFVKYLFYLSSYQSTRLVIRILSFWRSKSRQKRQYLFSSIISILLLWVWRLVEIHWWQNQVSRKLRYRLCWRCLQSSCRYRSIKQITKQIWRLFQTWNLEIPQPWRTWFQCSFHGY